jgi:PilZ domain
MRQKAADSTAVLTREVSVRVVDVSASGCLLETSQRLRVGTVGRLKTTFGRAEYAEDFEVVRCESIDRATSIFHIGVRFLWTSPRGPGSIRYAVSVHAAEWELSDTGRVM